MTSDIIAAILVVGGPLGLVASVFVARRRGLAAGALLAAWSSLLLGLWLVGATQLVARIVSAVSSFALGLVFSPIVWAGIGMLGLAAVLFLASAVARRRRPAATAGEPEKTAETGRGGGAKPAVSSKAPADDNDFSDIEDILRRRGIS